MRLRKSTNVKTLGTDAKGRFFRNLGYVKSKSGKYSQKKFYLGHDEDLAQLAVARLTALWKCVVQLHDRIKSDYERGILRNDEQRDIENANFDLLIPDTINNDLSGIQLVMGQAIWTNLTLLLAEAIRQGKPSAKIPLAIVRQLPEFSEQRIESKYILAPWLDRVRRQYSVIHIDIDDEPLNTQCQLSLNDRASELLAEGHRLKAEPLVNQKLHYAIEAYVDYVKKNTIDTDGETTEWGKAKTRQIQFVKTHSANVDLSQLAGPTIDAILQILSQRPLTKRNGEPCSKSFVKSCNKEFKAFLKWLEEASQYQWQWPENFEYKPPGIVQTPKEQLPANKSRKRKINTYSVDELATLYQYAAPIQRAYLTLSLNCGFANAELCTLLCDDIFLRQPHPDKGIINLNSSNGNSWIARERTKTQVLGTWKLWPETIMAIDWWYEQRKGIEDRFMQNMDGKSLPFEAISKGMFFITSTGKPIAEKSRRTGRIPNSWNSLIGRVKKDNPQFKRLSFKFLRKSGSDFVRALSRRELAKAYLSQGKTGSENDEVDFYANVPYQQLFDVLDELHEFLTPVWASVENPFPVGRKLGGKDNLTPGQIKKMKSLRSSGVSVGVIAEKLGTTKSTVYRRTGRNSLAE